MTKGYLIDIQHFSVHDGDGIRSTIFFAGCPLRCAWCSNPESFTTMNKVMHIEKLCITCHHCLKVCPKRIGAPLNLRSERLRCTHCGQCVAVCPTGARKNMIFEYTAEKVLKEVSPYFGFFRRSRGGVTYSGGECTLQIEFLTELTEKFYDLNIHQAIETEGYFELNRVSHIFEKIDLVFVDIKQMDTKVHRYFTGKGNEVILDNIKKLGKVHKNIIVRVPLIEGVNADEENMYKTAQFVKQHIEFKPRMELLPYHRFGDAKYETLQMTKPSEFFTRPTSEKIATLEKMIEDTGVEVVRYQ